DADTEEAVDGRAHLLAHLGVALAEQLAEQIHVQVARWRSLVVLARATACQGQRQHRPDRGQPAPPAHCPFHPASLRTFDHSATATLPCPGFREPPQPKTGYVSSLAGPTFPGTGACAAARQRC